MTIRHSHIPTVGYFDILDHYITPWPPVNMAAGPWLAGTDCSSPLIGSALAATELLSLHSDYISERMLGLSFQVLF